MSTGGLGEVFVVGSVVVIVVIVVVVFVVVVVHFLRGKYRLSNVTGSMFLVSLFLLLLFFFVLTKKIQFLNRACRQIVYARPSPD